MPQPNDVQNPRAAIFRKVRRAGLAALVVVVAILANGIWVRLQARSEQVIASAEQAIPTVSVLHPKQEDGNGSLVLPGSLDAFSTAHIYPRVSGYVREWYKDIGAIVHRGDLLAEVDTPELDQQIEQAQANLANAIAAEKLSKSTAERWKNLLAISAVSKQDADEKEADYDAKSALVKAAKANVVQLQSLKAFAHIRAPFEGVVTARSTDIGSLVAAGNAGSALFTVADMHKIRVYIRVPQNYSAQVHDGMRAQLSLPEYPGQTFGAKLVSTSNAISDSSNTLLVQLEADNKDGKLKPGAYAQVSLEVPRGAGLLALPVSTLIFRGDGLQVATLGPQNRVVMKPVQIARDLGSSVEINAGLTASDGVIDNPPDSLQNGDTVRVANAPRADVAAGE